MVLTMHSTMTSSMNQIDEMSEDATEMGRVFDQAKSDDSFYLPPEVFKNKDFQRAMKLFLSPDGKAVRFIISHRGDPATPEGIKRVDAIKTAAEEAVKGTPLGNSKVSLAGAAATAKDWQDGSTYDLLIAGIAALCLIFIIMLIITRSLVAALVIILLAVGSDYNLLLVSRMKEELSAGINTGIIRAMGGSGKVVSSAGLVFGFTMMSMVVSDLRIIGQVGTTIGLGLLVDTFIVRSFITPSIAAILGRWFWWPQRVRPRPASFLLRDTASRPVVRELLLGEPPVSGSVQ
jgi:RND superfamily putative drug exporter